MTKVIFVHNFKHKEIVGKRIYGGETIGEHLAIEAKMLLYRQSIVELPANDEWWRNCQDCEIIPECQGITVLINEPSPHT